ncbi:MAG TPA: hypothetical protein VGE07_23550 [Herpetosiphonaceae bacterium]
MTTLQLPSSAPIGEVRRIAWQIRGWLDRRGVRVYRLDASGAPSRVFNVRQRGPRLETWEADGEAMVWVAATELDKFYETI